MDGRASGLSFEGLLILNIGYDVLARCTSAVVEQRAADGQGAAPPVLVRLRGAPVSPSAPCVALPPDSACLLPVQLRNMDWDSDELRRMVIDVDFVRGGQLLFRSAFPFEPSLLSDKTLLLSLCMLMLIVRSTTWAGFVGVLTASRPPSAQRPTETGSLISHLLSC